jgi:CRP/FNR family cyclic AMP-dependent transcriptional regulator
MYLKQGDIFWGMSSESLKKINAFSRKTSYTTGRVLFEAGDPADRFFSLVKGRVKLTMPGTGQTVYTVSRGGEAFGWSSLIDRDVYSASALVTAPSVLLVIEKDALAQILRDYPGDGCIFFRQLAHTLGERLMQSYDLISTVYRETLAASQGTGQVQEEIQT